MDPGKTISPQPTPSYLINQEDFIKEGRSIKNKGIIALVTAVALAVFGIVLCALASPWGVAPLLASLPFFYFGINNVIMGKNVEQAAKEWQSIADPILDNGGTVEEIKEAAKRAIGQKTFLYNWTINSFVERSFEKMKQPSSSS